MKRALTYTLLSFITASLYAFPITECDTTWYTGEGTQYGGVAGSNGGNCGIYVAEDDFLHCAMNHTQYDSSYACGACVRVFGPLGEITVKVVDRCPECKHGDIDFSTQAFIQIAKLEDGRVPIKWQFVPCEEEENIKVKFEEGTSQFYFKAIFYDIRYRINQVEYQRSDGTWHNIHREMYNYYVENAGIDEDKSKIGPYVFRLISSEGDTIVTEPVTYKAGTEIDLGIQFPLHDCDSLADIPNTAVPEESFDNESIQAIEIYDITGRFLKRYHSWEDFQSEKRSYNRLLLVKEINTHGETRQLIMKD